MIWAIKDGIKIEATPNSKAICDICGDELIAKCGDIKIWHWSHKSNSDCDSWAEHETQWHKDWKNEFSKEQQEVVIGKHRADIKVKNLIVELQNSPISSLEIIERENYYGKDLIWLLNGDTIGKGMEIREKKGIITFRWKNPPQSWWSSNNIKFIDFSSKLPNLLLKYKSFEQGRKTYANISQEVSNDYGDGYHWETEAIETTKFEKEKARLEFNLILSKPIFFIKKIYPKCPCGGWGILLSKEEFLNQVKNGY